MTSMFLFGTIFLVFIGHGLTVHLSTSGKGGDTCGNSTCLWNKAACVRDQCVCSSRSGNGNLVCYRRGEYRTEVTNDPSVLTYNYNSIDLPIPCRYLLTHVINEYRRKKRVVGFCELMIHVFHKKKFGKFYVAGYDAAIRVETTKGSRYEVSIRKYGQADGGKYDFTIKATNGSFLPNGPFANDGIEFRDPSSSVRVRCKMDKRNNLAILKVNKCGFHIHFRPYDVTERRHQRQAPGIAVGVSIKLVPKFDSVDRVLALPSIRTYNGFGIHSIIIPGLGRMGRVSTMMYRAYMSGIPQTQPDPNPSCTAAKDSLTMCSSNLKLQLAFKNCLWIMKSPRFIRCYDPSDSGVYIQALFNTCVDIYCAGTRTCHDVIDLMAQTNCLGVPRYPRLSSFVSSCV